MNTDECLTHSVCVCRIFRTRVAVYIIKANLLMIFIIEKIKHRAKT